MFRSPALLLPVAMLLAACGARVAAEAGSGGAAASTGKIGAPCASDADCAAPETCLTTVPGGYCTLVIPECPAELGAGGVCPTGSECVNGIAFGGVVGDYCLALCKTISDCRKSEGYACCLYGTAGICTTSDTCF